MKGYQSSFVGGEGDEKPIDGIINGSTFVELADEGLNVYIFDGENKKWVLVGGSGDSGTGGKGIGEAPTDGKDYVRYNAMWKEVVDAPLDGKQYIRHNGQWRLLPHIPDISEFTGANKDLSNLSEEGKNKFLACVYENENLKSIVEHQDYGISRMVGNKKTPEIAINNTNIGQISGETFHEIAVGSMEREDAAGITIRKDEISMGVSKEYKVSEGNSTDSTKKLELLFKPEFDRPVFKMEYTSPTGGGSTFTDDLAMVSDLDGKVDVVEGYGLSQENFTPAEKAKLAGLESSHFKGSYLTLASLQAAVPTSEDGGYAYVGDVGEEAVNYIWDIENSAWTLGGKGTNDTPAQVKEKYESNADTNVFTDAEKQKLANLPSTLGGLGATTWTTTFKTSEPYDSLKVYYIEYGTTNAFRGGNTIKYGDSLISTEGKTYFVTKGVDKGSAANIAFGAQRVEDHEITGKPGAKGETGEKGSQGEPGKDGKDGVDGANKDLSNLSEEGEVKFLKPFHQNEEYRKAIGYNYNGVASLSKSLDGNRSASYLSMLGDNGQKHAFSAHDINLDKHLDVVMGTDKIEHKLTTGGKNVSVLLDTAKPRPYYKNEITGEEGELALKSDVQAVSGGANKDLSNLSYEGDTKFVKSKLLSNSKEKSIYYGKNTTEISTNHSTKSLSSKMSTVIDDNDRPIVESKALNGSTMEEGVTMLDERSFTAGATKKSASGEVSSTFLTLDYTSTRPWFENQSKQISGQLSMMDDVDKKVDKVAGYGLSQENFTTAEKTKLAGLTGGDNSGSNIWLTTSDPETMEMWIPYHSIMPAQMESKPVNPGDIILSTTGQFYIAATGIEGTEIPTKKCQVIKTDNRSIKGLKGDKGEKGQDGMQGAPGLPGREGTNGKDGLGVGDIKMGEYDTGRKDIFGQKIYRFATVGTTSGTAGQAGPLLVSGVSMIWGFGGCFGDGTALQPIGTYITVSSNSNFAYTMYPHIVGSDMYLYHYLLKDKLNYYIYVEYTKTGS